MDWENPELIYERDGNQWFCRRRDFINLHESPGGFGDTKADAYADLLLEEEKQKNMPDLEIRPGTSFAQKLTH